MSELHPFVDEFSKETWMSKYKDEKDNNVEDTWWRVANGLASVEKDKKLWAQKFYDILSKFNTLGGRVLSNIGIDANGTSAFNCFVLSPRDEKGIHGIDSMEGIMNALKEQALTLKSEGGYGFNCGFMRPRGCFIAGIKSESPGPIAMLDMWDTQADVITRGSGMVKDRRAKKSIRKGAQMVTLDVTHPDIEEFITAKQTSGRLTKFNMSVCITDDFMRAVEKDGDWDLEFPDVEYKDYNKKWNGHLSDWKKQGLPVIIYKTINAKKLYDLIMKSTYNRAEPGVLFLDTMNRLNNLYPLNERVNATNPCGEQILPDGGVCLLGSLNLVNYVNKDRTDWDYDSLAKDIPIMVRMMDNVNDVSTAPLPIQMESIKNKRRIGMGVLGYASALLLMKIRYGSKQCIKLTEKFCKFWANTSYQSSALLAKEKEPFPLYNEEYLKSEYLKVLNEDTINLIKRYGMRNSHVLSIAPTGNTSIYANVSSGGLEPIFAHEYIRTAITYDFPKGLTIYRKEEINWDGKKNYSATENDNWKWDKEGDDVFLKFLYDGTIYKIDKNRGFTKEIHCMDWGVRILKNEGTWDHRADWADGAMKLGVEDHVNVMQVFAKYVDAAISKTVCLPNKFSYKKFKELYMDAWKTGTIKGMTTYRDGTMGSVLKVDEEPEHEEIIKDDIELPQNCQSESYTFKSEGRKWYFHTTFFPGTNNKPFALFINTNHNNKSLMIKNAVEALTDLARTKYIPKRHIDLTVDKIKTVQDSDKLARLISLNLRHGVSISNICGAIESCKPTVGTLLYVIMKLLMSFIVNGIKAEGEYCEQCKAQVVYSEGCKRCSQCSWSKC